MFNEGNRYAVVVIGVTFFQLTEHSRIYCIRRHSDELLTFSVPDSPHFCWNIFQT